MTDIGNSASFGLHAACNLFDYLCAPEPLLIVILNLTDGAFVGHGAGADSLAAINIAAPIFTILSGIGMMFGIGGPVVASIHLSKGEVKLQRTTGGTR